MGHFSPKSPIISGSFAERDLCNIYSYSAWCIQHEYFFAGTTRWRCCVYTWTSVVCIHCPNSVNVYTAPEASWRRVFDPWTPLLFNLYHYLEQNGASWWVPKHAPGPSSQVLPGGRVRHPLGSKKDFVWYMYTCTIPVCEWSAQEWGNRTVAEHACSKM